MPRLTHWLVLVSECRRTPVFPGVLFLKHQDILVKPMKMFPSMIRHLNIAGMTHNGIAAMSTGSILFPFRGDYANSLRPSITEIS
jgi:hypothetical protein